MLVLELFSGTGSISEAFEARGHKVIKVDWDEQFDADLHIDVLKLTAEYILKNYGRPDVIWASPDCKTYSIAAISHHRYRHDSKIRVRKQDKQGFYKTIAEINPDKKLGKRKRKSSKDEDESENAYPKSDYARKCDRVNMHFHNLIMMLSPKVWFIENPRGAMRKMDFMHGLSRYTVTYCQYGDKRMKPTDIWTNHPDPKFKPPCENGAPCHEAAPRGSKTGGTQGIKSEKDRSRIPRELCDHIADICEEIIDE